MKPVHPHVLTLDDDIDTWAREVGVVEILDKPLRVQTLRQALARHLGTPPPG